MSCGDGLVGAGPVLLSFLGIPGETSCGHPPQEIMGAPSFRQALRILLDSKAPKAKS